MPSGKKRPFPPRKPRDPRWLRFARGAGAAALVVAIGVVSFTGLDLDPRNPAPAPAVVGAAPPATCSEARDRGLAPMVRSDPGYSAELDADGDGIACEPPPRS